MIVGLAAFWRSETPDGLSISLDFRSGGGAEFASALRRSMAAYDANSTPEDCVAWLAAIAPHKAEGFSGDILQRAVATIDWLERRGHLRSDEFNGVVWIARCGGELVGFYDVPEASDDSEDPARSFFPAVSN
jgi:hypothetical protein